MTDDLGQVEILVVEDNHNDYELTARALKKINLANKIYWVQDGVEALEFIFCTGKYAKRSMDNGPRLILLDLKLPKIDGIQVLEKIKSGHLPEKTPVVMLTSSQDRE